MKKELQIFAYDIETYDNGKTSNKYLSCFTQLLTNIKNITVENYKKHTCSFFCRHDKEDNNFLKERIDNNINIILLIHNLDYEYWYISNLDIFKQTKNVDIICDGKSCIKSLHYKFGKGKGQIKIFDTYKILNNSIKKLGDSIDLPKLDYNYHKERYYYTSLAKEEYEYNERDNIIALISLSLYLKKFDWFVNPWKDTKISGTSFNKYDILRNAPREDIIKNNKVTNSLYLDEKFYKYCINATHGGQQVVNPCTQYKIVNNAVSLDISSAHPYQALTRYYPCNVKQCTIFDNHIKDIKTIIPKIYKNPNILMKPQIFTKSGIFKVTFYNLKCKRFQNNNIIPTLSTARVNTSDILNKIVDGARLTVNEINKIDKIVPINGKVLTCKELTIVLTKEDILNTLLFYECDKITIIDGYEYSMIPQTELIKNMFKKRIDAKQFYKKLDINNISESDMNKYMYYDDIELYKKGHLSKEKVEDSYNKRCKPDLNGLFGIIYQNNIRDDFYIEDNEIKKAEMDIESYIYDIKNKKQLKPIFHILTGGYIAQYTVLEQSCMILHAIKNDTIIINGLTDSIKIINNSNNLQDFENKINKILDNINGINDEIMNTYGIGIVENENEKDGIIHYYKKMACYGNLRYITLKDKIDVKSSGANVMNVLNIKEMPQNNTTFNYIHKLFIQNTVIVNNKYNKGINEELNNIIKINEKVKLTRDMTTCNTKTYIKGKKCINTLRLIDVPVTLIDYTKKAGLYKHICEQIQNNLL